MNSALRWKFFSQLPDKHPDENTDYDLYKPTTALDTHGEAIPTYTWDGYGKCLWFFPKQIVTLVVQGQEHNVDVIILFKPDVVIDFLYLVKLSIFHPKWLRVIGIQDMKSHIEAQCTRYLPDSGLLFPRSRAGIVDISLI